MKNFKNRFANRFEFSSHNINKFILLLRNGVYPYEYLEDLEIFNKTSLPKKEDFYRY